MLNNNINNFAIIGAGSWGTTLGMRLADTHGKATLYLRDAIVEHEVNTKHTNVKYLKNFTLPAGLKASTDFSELNAHQAIIVVVPSIAFREAIELIKAANYATDKPIIIATKGLDLTTGMLLTDVVKSILPMHISAILSGPNLADEVAKASPAAINIACANLNIAKIIAEAIESDNLLTSITIDTITPQIAGTIKNIVAIMAGIFDALKFGHNAKAFLLTQGLKEIKDLSIALGGEINSCFNVSAIGDLSLGIHANRSRNYTFGYELAGAEYPDKFVDSYPYLVEGIYACTAIGLLKNKYEIDIPLCDTIIKLLKEPLLIKNSFNNFRSLISA